jgi:MFS family permease
MFVGGLGQNLAGMIALNNLSFQLFSLVGINEPFIATAIFDCVQLAGAIVGALYLDKGGRRHNLLVGSVFLVCFILIVGVGQLDKSKAMNDANFVFLLFYAFTFHATWAAAWVYPSEISYAEERSTIASFAMGAHFGGATVLVGVIAMMLAWSTFGTFVFFAFRNLISFTVVYFFTVETKYKRIAQIVERFQSLYPSSRCDVDKLGYINL